MEQTDPAPLEDKPRGHARHIADGIKLAVSELSKEESPRLRDFVRRIFAVVADEAQAWFGRKLLAALGAALFAAAIWLVTKKW